MPSITRSGRAPFDRLYTSGHVLLALAPLLWAANWILGRGLRENPPFAMALLRWVFAVAFMSAFCWPFVRRDWPVIRRHWRWLLIASVLGGGIGNALTYIGLQRTTAINGVFLNSFVPVMIILLSWVFLGQRLRLLQAVGVAVSFAGVLCIVTRGSLDALLALRLNSGDLILLTTLLLWSVYTIVLRWRPGSLHAMSLLFVLAVQAIVVLLPFCLYEIASGRRLALTVGNLTALAFIGLFSSFLAYVMYNRGVELCGAHLAGLYTHLMPVYGVLLAWVFLDERLAPFHVLGIGLIAAGIWLASQGPLWRASERAGPDESPG